MKSKQQLLLNFIRVFFVLIAIGVYNLKAQNQSPQSNDPTHFFAAQDTDHDGVPNHCISCPQGAYNATYTCNDTVYPEYASEHCLGEGDSIKFFLINTDNNTIIKASPLYNSLYDRLGTEQGRGGIFAYYTPFIIPTEGCYRLEVWGFHTYLINGVNVIDSSLYFQSSSFCYFIDPNLKNIQNTVTTQCNSKTVCFKTTANPYNAFAQNVDNGVDSFTFRSLIMLDALGNGFRSGSDDMVWCTSTTNFNFNNQNCLNFTYPNFGTYRARVLYVNHCGIRVDTVTVVLKQSPAVSISTSSTNICVGGSTQLSAGSNIAGTTYTWNTGQTSNSLTVAPTATTTYTVTATANGCSTTASYTVTVLPSAECCSHSGTGLTYYNDVTFSKVRTDIINTFGTAYTNTSLSVANIQNLPYQIVFNGKLIMDVNAQILGCRQLKFSKNGQVVINNNLKVGFYSSTLDACGSYAWGGIVVNPTQYLVVDKDMYINHANIGITANYPWGLDVRATKFTNCRIGIRGTNVMNDAAHFVRIETNRFDYTTANGNTLLLPYSTLHAMNGIELYYSGGFSIKRNEVNNHNNGFSLSACPTLNIDSNKFFGIKPYNSSSMAVSAPYGRAIYGEGVNVSPYTYTPVSQTVNATGNLFVNNYSGIELKNYNSTIVQNTIDTCAYGINVNSGLKKTISISSNTMNNVGYGIATLQNKYSTISINKNVVHLINPDVVGTITTGLRGNYYGILVNDWQGMPSKYQIATNNIYNGQFGIKLLNMRGYQDNVIKDNYIDFSQWINSSGLSFNKKVQQGIYIENCSELLVTDNTMIGMPNMLVYNNTSSKTGLFTTNSTNNRIACNLIQDMGYGMHIQGDNSLSWLMNNEVHNARAGIFYNKLGTYGRLGNQGEPYGGTNNNYWAIANNNLFTGTFTPNIGHTYNQTTTAQPATTVDKYYYLSGVTSAPTINNNNTSLAVLNIQAEPYNTNYTLPANISPFQCTTAIGAGMVAPPSGGGESALTEKEQIAEAMVVYPEFEEGAKWLEERKLYRELDKDTTLADESIILDEFYTDMTNEALGRLEALKNGEKEISDAPLFDYATYEQKIAQLKLANEQIISIENQEQKEKQINALFYRTVEQGVDSLTEEEQNLVASLAYGCPLVDGEAVFLARAMHQLIDPTAHYNSKEICNNLGYYKTTAQNDDDNIIADPMDNSYCMLYPNPAHQQSAINYVLAAQDRMQIKVYDVLGREVFQKTTTNNMGSETLPTDRWQNGNYIVKCISLEGKEFSFKLAVAH